MLWNLLFQQFLIKQMHELFQQILIHVKHIISYNAFFCITQIIIHQRFVTRLIIQLDMYYADLAIYMHSIMYNLLEKNIVILPCPRKITFHYFHKITIISEPMPP